MSKIHDSLRELALYLMETALRAKTQGVPNIPFTAEGLTNMAATIMEAVVDLEGPNPTPGTPPAPQPPSTSSSFDDMLKRLRDMQEQAQAQYNAAVENANKYIEEFQKRFAEKQSPPPVTP